MHIVLIGPGYMSIPPVAWGAVETLIWDYHENLIKKGHQSTIINTADISDIVYKTNAITDADFVHIMYDDYIVVAPQLKCPRILYTSHFAYLTDPEFGKTRFCASYYENIFRHVIDNSSRIIIHAISDEIAEVYKRNGFTGEIHVVRNGAREDLFNYTDTHQKSDRSVYIGKIEGRKNQYKYQCIKDIDFVGPCVDTRFDKSSSQFMGEWSKGQLYRNLTEYGDLVLLSDGEADPLVVKEALMAGLGVVVSECASANLNTMLPFITVIPNSKLDDIGYVEREIRMNREICKEMRPEIRAYGLGRFSWNVIIDEYIALLNGYMLESAA